MTSNESNLPVHVGDVPKELLALAQAGKLENTNETLKEHRILNRLALVQAMSSELKKKYEEGAVVIPGADTLVLNKEDSVDFVPVMFYDEYVTWWDRKDKTKDSPIRDKSLDKNGEIAAKCSDRNLREEAYTEGGKEYTMRHTHHLNFLILLTSGPLAGQLCALSFSRSGWSDGRRFIGAIQMRRIPTEEGLVEAPMFATQWKLGVSEKSNDEGNWFAFDVQPAESPWTPSMFLKPAMALNEELLKDYKDQAITVDHEAGSEESTDYSDAEM